MMGGRLARTVVGGAAVAGVAGYRARRWLVARALRLPPPRTGVTVERDLAVPMPDGVTLLADHYVPRTAESCPTILMRTPYGRGREAGLAGLASIFLAQRIAEQGYHVVVQGVRGRYDSGGRFDPLTHEGVDGRATLDWIAARPWFNGALGMWGPSYLGFVQWAVAAESPAFLKALVPAITFSRGRDVSYPEGAFALELNLRWSFLIDAAGSGRWSAWQALRRSLREECILSPAFQRLPVREADVVAVGQPVDFYRAWLAHPREDDPYWQASDHRAAPASATAAVHLISGWYDVFLPDLLRDHATMVAAGRAPYLTIGPWTHLSRGGVWVMLREGITWFDATLRGDRSRLRPLPVRVYVMGADEWRDLTVWPPPATETPHYLHGGGVLSVAGPLSESPPDRYHYDPADPTPSVGGPLFGPDAGPRDNRALEARPDVLTYTSQPLTADLDVIGPVRLDLYARSTLAHTDFVGRLCDVYPDGRSVNICDGLIRAEPGAGEPVEDTLQLALDMRATAYRFRAGHRLRLLISSGAHPRWNRNAGTGEPPGDAMAMRPADQTVYHDARHPSALILPVTNG